MFFGRTVRDHIPCLPYTNTASTDWCISQELKERMMAKSREVDGEKLARNLRRFKALRIRTQVANQNQSGETPTNGTNGSDQGGEAHEQIVIKVDGK